MSGRRSGAVDFDELARKIEPDELAEAIGAEHAGSGWRCPLGEERHTRGDRDPSFSVFRDGERTAARCHGCGLRGSPVTVAAEVWGLEPPDAARKLAREIGMTPPPDARGDGRSGGNGRSGRREVVETYPYVDEDENLLFEVVRFRPKAFRQRRPDGEGGWEWSTRGVRRVLFRLPRVLWAVDRGERVFVVEGEKDVLAVESAGATATTNPGGAGKWRSEYTETLRGARAGVVADRDAAGREHAWAVARELEGVARTVAVLEPAVEEEGADVADHLEAGYDLSDLVGADEPPGKESTARTGREGRSGDSGDPEGEEGDGDGGWREPIPLGPRPPEDLPSEPLPSPLREHVDSVAAFTQTPTGLPLTLGLAACSAAVAGKAVVEVRSGWREPLNLYLAAVLDPANRKSPVEKAMVAPIREYEREGAREVGPDRRAALDRRDALEKRVSQAKREVADASTPEEEGQALSDLEEARRRLEELDVPTPPRLLVDDVTPEALGKIMAENAGRAAIVSSEGDVLRIFAGRYNSGGDPTLDVIKKAWSGDPVRVDRVGRDGAHLPRPLLTVGLTLQATLLDTLANRDVLEGEGVLARFLWMAPPSLIGERLTGADVPPPDAEARQAYERLLRDLLGLEPAAVDPETGEWEPHVLELDPEARDRLYAWEAEVEDLLADGGDLAPVRAWGGKLVGTTVRLAGLLQVVERAGRRAPPFTAPVSPAATDSAIRLARAFVPHARYVLADEAGVDEELELARYVLRRVREAGEPELTERDLWQLCRGKTAIEDMGDLREVLARLEAHRLVRRVRRPREGPGREPSPRVEFNPRARDNVPRIPRKARDGDPDADSGDSGDTGGSRDGRSEPAARPGSSDSGGSGDTDRGSRAPARAGPEPERVDRGDGDEDVLEVEL